MLRIREQAHRIAEGGGGGGEAGREGIAGLLGGGGPAVRSSNDNGVQLAAFNA